MLSDIEKDQRAKISHRMNFIGRPTGPNTISWQYNGKPWRFQRPEDGQPPISYPVRCAVCGKTLTYTVHSIQDTHRRYRRKRLLAWTGLAMFLGAGAVLIALALGHHLTALALAVTIPVGFVGFETLWVGGLAVTYETGVTGHLTSWPSATKHQVDLIGPPPAHMPRLICPHCGHEEETPHGVDHRKSLVERRYQAAKARFERHQCG
jgi:rRNA maturation protein Nop10